MTRSDARDRNGRRPIADQSTERRDLPPDISLYDWELEKVRRQNPRIRSLLGCIRLLDEVSESNYAILHCSPGRLQETWKRVQQVAELIRTELGGALQEPSVVPSLEGARRSALRSLGMLDRTVLTELDRLPTNLPPDRLLAARRLLCMSIGKIHAFLQDTLGETLAADPRSLHDADYFLSRRFPRDIEEAEWLHEAVSDSFHLLHRLDTTRLESVTAVTESIHREGLVPAGREWEALSSFLEVLLHELVPKMQELLALPGIRFEEMEVLDVYSQEIPMKCRSLIELGATGREAVLSIREVGGSSRPEREQNVRDLVECHSVVSERMLGLLRDLDKVLQDLMVFIPLWIGNIERRRALMLKSTSTRGGQATELPD